MSIKAFTDYLQLEKKYSPHTVKAYLKDLEAFSHFLEETFQEKNLSQVHYNLIRNWIIHLVEVEQLDNTSVNRKIASLKSFYKFLLKTKQIEVFPLANHKALKTSKKLQVPFSEDEINKVLQILATQEGFKGTRNKLLVELFYATGIRRAELISLKLNDVSTSAGTIKVLGKRNKERIIPLIPHLNQSVKSYLLEREKLSIIKDSQYFFLSKKGVKLYETLVYRIINSYFSLVSEKVKKSPHIIRHSFATHLLNQGANLNAVKELLGHASLASTQVYTQHSMAQLKEVYKNAHPRNK